MKISTNNAVNICYSYSDMRQKNVRKQNVSTNIGIACLKPLKKDIVSFGNLPKPLARMSYHKVKGNPNMYDKKAAYQIDFLLTTGCGSGTNSVQKIVRESLSDSETRGRVALIADCIDGHSYPAGFYYKLGFRFNNERYNSQLAEWLKNGGKRKSAPTMSGVMYLPEENIEHCLNYRKNNIK